MKPFLGTLAGAVLACLLALALWGCKPKQEPGHPLGLINAAPCYSGLCNSSCPNRMAGIGCGTTGHGSQCYSGSPCRGIILDK